MAGSLTFGVASAGCTSIFVGNLPYNVSQQAVADIFRPIGGRRNIVRVSVKQGKGFAHVEFNLTVTTTTIAHHHYHTSIAHHPHRVVGASCAAALVLRRFFADADNLLCVYGS